MTLTKPSNVQEIRGKFENWNNGVGHRENIIPLGKPPETITEVRPRSYSVYEDENRIRNNAVISRTKSLYSKTSNNNNNKPLSNRQQLVENIVSNIKHANHENINSHTYKCSSAKPEFKENEYTRNYFKNHMQEKEAPVNSYYNGNDITPERHSYQDKSIYDNVTDKYLNNLNVETTEKPKLLVKNQLNSYINPVISAKSYQNINFQSQHQFPEPMRPPRRKINRKKNLAPSANHKELPTTPNSAASHHNLSTLIRNDHLVRSNNKKYYASEENVRYANKDCFPGYQRVPFNATESLPRNPNTVNKCQTRGAYATLQSAKPPIVDSPPMKPPRTFAHDIYQESKQRKDIEALYAKPMKKNKPISMQQELLDKSVSFLDSPVRMRPKTKPPIAPKPNLPNYKRHSVIEPLETSKVKRNSSFRFSFRKPRTNTPAATKQIARLKEAMKSFQVRMEDIRRLSKSAEHINRKNKSSFDDHVYAVPHPPHKKRAEDQQELHYMCSPLFPMEKEEHTHKEELSSSKQGLNWNGLKKEFRQSCRMVQKRIKEATVQ